MVPYIVVTGAVARGAHPQSFGSQNRHIGYEIKQKDPEQAARRALGASLAYASARTRLAEAQMRRIDQLRLRDERQLIEARAVQALWSASVKPCGKGFAQSSGNCALRTPISMADK